MVVSFVGLDAKGLFPFRLSWIFLIRKIFSFRLSTLVKVAKAKWELVKNILRKPFS